VKATRGLILVGTKGVYTAEKCVERLHYEETLN